MGPVPPGIFGFLEGEAGINPVVYDWVNGAPRRKPIAEARKLLSEAGYPEGREAASGTPLVLYLDTVGTGPGDKPRLDWYRRQFEKLNIQLEIRESDWNRFQDKILHGRTQLFFLGWNADYPDPENFMFLLYGPNARAKNAGENAANYTNPEYDALFQKMKNLPSGPERMELIERMVKLLREDAPWVWGFHPRDYSLLHQWVFNVKPSHMGKNGVKFYRVDAALRQQKQLEWNRPVLWPIGALLVLLVASGIPAYRSYRRRELSAAR